MKNTIKLLTFSIAMTASLGAYAEVYKHTDAQGNVSYSDEASPGAKTIKVKPVTTVTLPKPDEVPQMVEDSKKKQEQDQGKAYNRVSFDAPENNSAFHSGNGDVTFAVSSSPALLRGHEFEVSLDGQPVGQNASGQFTVNNIDRGTHNASVKIVDSKGKIIQSGQGISFTIHRPSVIN
ncbi:DUF4124 domain-containing protein [Marinobacter sp. BGYM27]|uniref:DUF4124 domain-containing protein n=1 Tax=unclassified Marinobacter TaxID=83889 RepID=UPI00325F9CF2